MERDRSEEVVPTPSETDEQGDTGGSSDAEQTSVIDDADVNNDPGSNDIEVTE